MAGAGSVTNNRQTFVFQQPKSQEVQDNRAARQTSWINGAMSLPNVAPTTFQNASASTVATVAPAAIVVPTRASNPNQIFRPMNVLQFDRRVTELLIAQQKKQYNAVNPELQKSYTDVLEEIKEVSAPGFVEPARSKTLAMMELNLLDAMIRNLEVVEPSDAAKALVEEMRARGVTVSGELYRFNLKEEEGLRKHLGQKLQGMKF